MSNLPPSYMDLRASENGNPFGRLWNALLTRLDAQRIVVKTPFIEESTGHYRIVGLGNLVFASVGFNGKIFFKDLGGATGTWPFVLTGPPQAFLWVNAVTNTSNVMAGVPSGQAGTAFWFPGGISTPLPAGVYIWALADIPCAANGVLFV